MVLDIDEFRPEKGGNPDKIRENQRKRFCDVSMVDKIVEADEKWRKGMCNYCWHNQALSKRLQRFLDIFSKYLFNFQRDLMLTNIISWRIWWAKWLVKKWRYVVCNFFSPLRWEVCSVTVWWRFSLYFFYCIRKEKVFNKNSNRNLYFRLLLMISRHAMKTN